MVSSTYKVPPTYKSLEEVSVPETFNVESVDVPITAKFPLSVAVDATFNVFNIETVPFSDWPSEILPVAKLPYIRLLPLAPIQRLLLEPVYVLQES